MTSHCQDAPERENTVKLTINMEPSDTQPKQVKAQPKQVNALPNGVSSMSGMSDFEDSSWRPYHDNIRDKMKVEFLYEALRTRERGLLEKAIQEAKEPPSISLEHPILLKAEIELEVATLKEGLRDARRSRQPHAIRDVLDHIPKSDIYMSRMQQEVAEARSDLVRLEHMIKLKQSVLDMDMKTMSEIRRYSKPPMMVHDVMKGVMLLFGEDEDTTSDWRVCQQQLNPHGRKGMNRRVLNFDHTAVHPQIAARVREILEEYKLAKVQLNSNGVATFYVWAMGMVEMVESLQPNRGSRPKPADPWRQKEIFGRMVELPNASPRGKRKHLPISARPQWK